MKSSENDIFGVSVDTSANGDIIFAGASGDTLSLGQVWIYSRNSSSWLPTAGLRASNAEQNDGLGRFVAISGDGNTIVASALGEDSAAQGINGDESDNSLSSAGAVYIFTNDGSDWSQQAYIKPSNTTCNNSRWFRYKK